MGTIHRFTGKIGEVYNWEGQRFRDYGKQPGASEGATVRWLIGKAEQAPTFALRYFEIMPGGHSAAEQHPYEHGVIIMRGKALVQLGDEQFEVEPHDVIFIPPDEYHQLVNPSADEVLGFFCIIPAHRRKGGEMVYAEGELFKGEGNTP